MTIYRWMMDRGAEILFAASLLIFAINLASSFTTGNFIEFPSGPGQSLDKLGFLLAIVGAFGTAVSHAALTFFGACFLYRLDAGWIGGVRK